MIVTIIVNVIAIMIMIMLVFIVMTMIISKIMANISSISPTKKNLDPVEEHHHTTNSITSFQGDTRS